MPDFSVTPYDVEGQIDYDTIVQRFGIKPLDDELEQRIKKIAGESHFMIRRRIYFAQRDMNWLLDQYEKGNKFYLYTGIAPSGRMTMAHLIPFLLTKWLQDKFDAEVYIYIPDEEKFLAKRDPTLTLDKVHSLAYEDALDIVSLGYNPKKTKIFLSTEYAKTLYKQAVRVAKHITFSMVKDAFGFTNETNVGTLFYTSLQSVPAFLRSVEENKNVPCLIPLGVDQDVHFRIARDVMAKLGYYKPSIIHAKFLPGLDGRPKMSSSDPNNTIYLNDSPEIVKNKIREGEAPGDIAILSRISTDFFNLKRILKNEGVDCVLISGESILKSQEGLDLLSVVRYLADPGDQVAQVGLLLSPLFGMTVSDLAREKGKFGEIIDSKLGRYRESLKSERIDFVLNRILLREGYVSALLGSNGGTERTSRLNRILELLSSHVSNYGGNAQSVAEWLENASNSKESGPIEDLLEDRTRVKIMTIHQAKGLEFNTVIVYDLRPGIDREKYYSDEYAGLVVKRDKDFITSPSRKIVGKSERHSFSLNEETRIMYVAFTRAKNDLHVIVAEKDLKEEKVAKKGDDLISILQRTIGLWKGNDAKERNEAITRISMIPSKVTKTEPIAHKEETKSKEDVGPVENVQLDVQDDEDNELAIEQFLREKGDRIKELRIFSKGSRVTISEGGIRIYEDMRISNSYFVKNGKIEYIL